jgi:ubiquinone/menaquinone biosynthesis C-methylase UbiE
LGKKTFFNQAARSWDDRFYTPETKDWIRGLVGLFHLRRGTRILDVGAGTGGIIQYLIDTAGEAGKIWAIDYAEEMVKIGREKFRNKSQVFFECASVESLPFENDFFDHAVCFGAFPHFEDKPRALKEMNRVLKVYGTLIIAHALSSQEIKNHHQNCGPVSQDFLPEEAQMKEMLENTGFRLSRLTDQPRCYLCEGIKIFY